MPLLQSGGSPATCMSSARATPVPRAVSLPRARPQPRVGPIPRGPPVARAALPGRRGRPQRLTMLLGIFFLVLPKQGCVSGGRITQGPAFRQEPPRHHHFTNTSGATIPCVAEGLPPPAVAWTHLDGRHLSQIEGLRQVLGNGSLHFLPFPAHLYDAEVHAATYTCRASSPAGTLVATPTLVRAVVVGEYEVQVYDQLVMAGNTAVLRCAVPSYVREYVTVTSWLHDSSFNIYPSLHGDGKYHMTDEGDLHVLEVGPQDGLSRFQCRSLHQLTGRSQLSRTPARIIITEAQGSVPPRMNERARRVVVPSGSKVTLPCVAQGHPPPTYTWYRGSSAVAGGSGLWAVGGSLVMGRVTAASAGKYTCVANNTAGETRFSAHLLVTTPLSVQVTPQEVQVDAGGRLELRCHVSGDPVDTVVWYKDGILLRSGGRVGLRPREALHVAPVEPSDAGIYQCAATYGQEYAHAHAYVTLGAAAPQLLYRFIEHTLQPGPAVSLKCIAKGTPTPHITWTLDGFPIPHSHRYLKGQYVSAQGHVISHVNVSTVHVTDGGTYSCSAENGAGRAVHSARLNVYGPPHVRPMGQLSAVAGETFTVTCPASGYPLHKITWRKDGVRLPTSHRQRVHANGTLVVAQVSRGADDGQYSCTVANRQGRSDTQRLSVRVMVAPVLQPFHFEEKLQAGDRAGVTCLVTKGDPPITFSWKKDGKPIQEVEGVSVSSMNHFSSALMISLLTALHTGEYTCTASNHWAAATLSASLAVNVPPAWVVEPASTNVALGGTVALHCLAKGFPNPSVAWRKETASGEFVGVATGEEGVAGWGNGTLEVSRAERRHEGRYLCEASNGVGAGLSKVVTLSVNEPPWFGVRSQREQVVVGGSGTLTCEAHGDAPLTLAWTKGAAPITPNSRYEMSERQVDSGRVSELVIRSAHITDSGTYVCRATNAHGSLTADFHLLVQDVPEPPSGVTVSEEGSRHLTLTWTSPADSNAPITAYLVTFDAHQTPLLGPREVTVEGDQRRVRLDALLPATTYTVTVEAENRVGRSKSSKPLKFTTKEEPPTGHPKSVTVMAVSSTALQVTWEPPQENLTHGTILGYYLGFKDESEGEAYNFTTVGVDGLGVTRATLAGLRPSARYAVVLQAFNSMGAGPASPPAHATTHQDKPSAPPGHVTCESVTSSSLLVTWSPPPPRHRNGLITSYRVVYSQISSHESSGSGSVVSEGLRATLAGLTPWSNYSVSVAASTRAGEGLPSHTLVCTTDQDVPEAPARVKAVVSGPLAVVVSWAPPARPHGRISRYTVHWETAGSRDGPKSRRVEPHLNHLTLHDLPLTTHQMWVTASTRMGVGPRSTVTVVKPSHTVPAGVWSVGGNLTAAWKEDLSLACGAVGVPEPMLSWTHRRKSIPAHHNRIKVQPDGTLTLADIQRNDSGSYICTATNPHGSDSVAYNLTVLVPPSAPSLHVTETTASSIRVQWSVEDTGGAALQGATLHYRSAGEEWLTVKVDGDRSAYTATGLRCGTLHHFYLTAYSHIGSSTASSTEAARTKGRPPEAPPKFQFVTTNSSQATLYLSQWTDGGCPITHYSVQYRRASTTHWTTVGSEIPPTRTFAVGGLDAGGRYELRVTAHNAAGATPAHYDVTTPGQGGTGGAGEGSGGGMWGAAPSRSSAWRDPRVLVPASVSAVALLLTLATVCLCLRRRPSGNPVQKEVPDEVNVAPEDQTVMETRDDVYITVRRAVPTPPQQQDLRDNSGEYSEEDLYPYATATFQMGGGSPPPPAPPSPPTHAAHVQQTRPHKGFTALVYQAPSLHDVDSPNISEVESRGFTYDASQTEGFGGVVQSSETDGRSPSHYRRPQRHLRTRSPATFASPKKRRLQPHHHYLHHHHYNQQQKQDYQQQQQEQQTLRPTCHPRQV